MKPQICTNNNQLMSHMDRMNSRLRKNRSDRKIVIACMVAVSICFLLLTLWTWFPTMIFFPTIVGPAMQIIVVIAAATALIVAVMKAQS